MSITAKSVFSTISYIISVHKNGKFPSNYKNYPEGSLPTFSTHKLLGREPNNFFSHADDTIGNSSINMQVGSYLNVHFAEVFQWLWLACQNLLEF